MTWLSIKDYSEKYGVEIPALRKRIKMGIISSDRVREKPTMICEDEQDGYVWYSSAMYMEIEGITRQALSHRIKKGYISSDRVRRVGRHYSEIRERGSDLVQWYSLDEYADIQGITRSGVDKQIKTGKIPADQVRRNDGGMIEIMGE